MEIKVVNRRLILHFRKINIQRHARSILDLDTTKQLRIGARTNGREHIGIGSCPVFR